MTHYDSLEKISLKNSWLTIGVFDGVHRGHQAIIQKLTAGAHSVDAPAVVLTFWPHPATVLGRGEVKMLTLPDERAGLLESLGVDVVVTHRFDADVAGLPAAEFMQRVQAHLQIRRLLIGYDFALGKGREGNARRLSELGREMDYEVDIIPAISDESGVISSTEIRKLVSVGNVAEAGKLLGHAYSLNGPVVRGDQRGRQIGFPTANIEYAPEKILPAHGIYACRARLDGSEHLAAVNIGVNPTFTPDKQTASVEAYILDFDRDIYGKDLSLQFVARLRDELKFDSVQALLEQIHQDVASTREIFGAR